MMPTFRKPLSLSLLLQNALLATGFSKEQNFLVIILKRAINFVEVQVLLTSA